jgi:hypothetical protein
MIFRCFHEQPFMGDPFIHPILNRHLNVDPVNLSAFKNFRILSLTVHPTIARLLWSVVRKSWNCRRRSFSIQIQPRTIVCGEIWMENDRRPTPGELALFP